MLELKLLFWTIIFQSNT